MGKAGATDDRCRIGGHEMIEAAREFGEFDPFGQEVELEAGKTERGTASQAQVAGIQFFDFGERDAKIC